MADGKTSTAKILAITFSILFVAAATATVVMAVKNNKGNKKLAEANAALKALGAPEIKTAKPTEAAAIAAGTAIGTAVSGSPAGTNAATA